MQQFASLSLIWILQFVALHEITTSQLVAIHEDKLEPDVVDPNRQRILYHYAGSLYPQTQDFLTNIYMTDDMFVKMDIYVRSFPTDSYGDSLFFIGKPSSYVSNINLWRANSIYNGFTVRFNPPDRQIIYSTNTLSGSSDRIELNKVYSLEVCWDQSRVTTRLSGGSINGIYTNSAIIPIHDNGEVPVYVGWPNVDDHRDADVVIGNLYIGSNADCSQPLDIKAPTRRPTSFPTKKPMLTIPTPKPTDAEAHVVVQLYWADGQDIGGSKLFEGAKKWNECDEGYVIAGFWKNWCQSVHCLERMLCVAPKISPIVSQTCYIQDIGTAFNSAGTVECDDGYFVRGIESSDNQGLKCGIQCWDSLRCCQYDTNQVEVSGTTETQNWWSCFDGSTKRWCLVDDGDYITGFRRTKNNNLYNLEEAKTRKLFEKGSVIGVPETPHLLNKPLGDGYYVEFSKPVFLTILGLIMIILTTINATMCCTKKSDRESKGHEVVKQIDSDSDNAEID